MSYTETAVRRVTKLASQMKDSGDAAVCKLADFGRKHGNQERNLHKWARRWLPVKPYSLFVPLTSDTSVHTTYEELYMLLPHEMFSALARQPGTMFQTAALGPSGIAGVKSFWDMTKTGDPQWFHQLGLEDSALPWTIPVVFHEDGVRIYKHSEVFSLSWSSQLSDDIDAKHVIAVLPAARMLPETEHTIVKVIAWSLDCMRAGSRPMRELRQQMRPTRYVCGSMRAHAQLGRAMRGRVPYL